MKILCTGDLHLGASPDFGREPHGFGSRLADQQMIWQDICQRTNTVDLVLFAGDAFHRRRPTPPEIVAFQSGIALSDAPFVAVDGNHDVTSPDLPSALSIIDHPRFKVARHPGVVTIDGVAIAALPWTPPSRVVAGRDGGDRDEAHRDVAQILVDIAAGLRRKCPLDMPTILLGHWSVSNAALSNGAATDDLREPVIPLADLVAQGWDWIVLGHIHQPQLLDTNVLYCGSPCVVDWGEADHRHGFWIIDTEHPGAPEFVATDDRPFLTLESTVDAGFFFPHAEIDGAVIRVRYRATREEAAKVDNHQVAQALLDDGAWRVFVQPDIVRQDRARAEGVDTDLAPQQALDLWLELQHHDDATLAGRARALTAAYLEQVAS